VRPTPNKTITTAFTLKKAKYLTSFYNNIFFFSTQSAAVTFEICSEQNRKTTCLLQFLEI
jgi:hypothetical protein